jgi:hypothetical protein
MLDRFMDRLMESATAAYMPRLEEMAKARKAELEEMKAKVRSDPDMVESWFDKEIAKLGNMDVKDMMKNAGL